MSLFLTLCWIKQANNGTLCPSAFATIPFLCCCFSVPQSCPTLCVPVDSSTPGFPVLHHLPELLTLMCTESGMPSNPFSSCPQSFPASGSFQMSRLFASGGQSTGASVSASVLPMNIQDWFPLGWAGWISLLSKGLSRVFSNTTVQKHQFFGTHQFFGVR